ncbi:class I SAM-dependent methyltransferase [Sphingobacterium spiritivorum]|nr:class I SAM-dependent methyltransferase [Sphingobacterium spiritivorum]QQS94569.1 class I SAM-dependent methyltransferase [Sphingobacterium spiritivorum]
MKQNIYDDSGFFDEYGKMPRSKEGLHAAGEWHVLKTMFPDFEHKNVLDLGCGYGWHCIYAMQQGASHVIGVDLSAKMIRKAKENSAGLDIDYRQMAIEDVNFATEEFDIVISSLALHYIKDLENVFQKVNHFLKRGGSFIFSMEHPIFTARAEQDWYKNEQGTRLHWPVDHYQQEGRRNAMFLGHDVIKYHRTMETLLNGVIAAGFTINRIAEPKPSDVVLEEFPEMKDESRRPVFILISATKN